MGSNIDIWKLLQSQLIGIELTNPLSYLYAILNVALMLFAIFFGSSSTSS